MPRFFIEVSHPSDAMSCIEAAEIFVRTGSHFLTRADWGCMDGEHKAWIIVDVDTKEDARAIVPAAYRAQARIVQLNSFSLAQVAELRRQHS